MSNTIKKSGTRVTIEIDEVDCQFVVSALKVASTTRTLGRKLVKNIATHSQVAKVIGPLAEQITSANDEDERRELALIQLFSKGL